MQKIALLMPEPYVAAHNYFRPCLTPGGDDVWEGTQFVVNPQGGEFDGVVVHQSVRELDRTHRLVCSPSRTLLALKEPPDVLFLPDGYTRQFHTVLGQDTRVRCPHRIVGQSAHHWFVEIPIDEARVRPIVEKPKLLSAVVSAKADTKGHRQRFQFMKAAKEHFGDRLDWFGRGVRDLGSRKLDGLADYRYHLVFENGAWPHYWTEKLADAYVANCVPIYWGAPNIGEYFDPISMLRIDIDDPASTFAQIEAAIENDMHTHAQTLLAKARAQVLDEYHPYRTYLDLFASMPAEPAREIVIRPHTEFPFTLGGRIRHKLWRWRHRA